MPVLTVPPQRVCLCCGLMSSLPTSTSSSQRGHKKVIGHFERKPSLSQNQVWGEHFSPCKSRSFGISTTKREQWQPSPTFLFAPSSFLVHTTQETNRATPAPKGCQRCDKSHPPLRKKGKVHVFEYWSCAPKTWPCWFLSIAWRDRIISIFRWGNRAFKVKLICPRSHGRGRIWTLAHLTPKTKSFWHN